MARRIDNDAVINSVRLDEQVGSPTGTASGYARVFARTDGLYIVNDSNETIGPFITGAASGLYEDYIYLYDKKASGTHGGTSAIGSWQTRNITNEVEDTGNLCSLSSNQFTLVTGTYRCLISAPAFGSTDHQARLYNITDGALEVLGTSEWNESATAEAMTRSFVEGRFTITAQKTFEVQHRVQGGRATDGWGNANLWGDNIYTVIELWRET